MKLVITATPNRVTKVLEFDNEHRFSQKAEKDKNGCWNISPTFREFITEGNGCYVDPDELSILDEMIYMDSDDEDLNEASTIAETLSSLKQYSNFMD